MHDNAERIFPLPIIFFPLSHTRCFSEMLIATSDRQSGMIIRKASFVWRNGIPICRGEKRRIYWTFHFFTSGVRRFFSGFANNHSCDLKHLIHSSSPTAHLFLLDDERNERRERFRQPTEIIFMTDGSIIHSSGET